MTLSCSIRSLRSRSHYYGTVQTVAETQPQALAAEVEDRCHRRGLSRSHHLPRGYSAQRQQSRCPYDNANGFRPQAIRAPPWWSILLQEISGRHGQKDSAHQLAPGARGEIRFYAVHGDYRKGVPRGTFGPAGFGL